MNLRIALQTAGGLGFMPIAPGTWGSLPPVALAMVLAALAVPLWMIDVSLLLLGLAFAIACVRFGADAEARFGRKDPSQVVSDEVAGQSIALLFLPWREPASQSDWLWNAAVAFTAFATFRIFDITKPPPANRLQRLPCGWGILVDDLVAGGYALIITQLAVRLALPLVI